MEGVLSQLLFFISFGPLLECQGILALQYANIHYFVRALQNFEVSMILRVFYQVF